MNRLQSQLAKGIRCWAKRAGLTLNGLADKAGVSRSHLYEVLRDAQSPTMDWLDAIADAVGTTAYYLKANAR